MFFTFFWDHVIWLYKSVDISKKSKVNFNIFLNRFRMQGIRRTPFLISPLFYTYEAYFRAVSSFSSSEFWPSVSVSIISIVILQLWWYWNERNWKHWTCVLISRSSSFIARKSYYLICKLTTKSLIQFSSANNFSALFWYINSGTWRSCAWLQNPPAALFFDSARNIS